ncbi:MAG TPA: glycosyl hydrolase family 18 protein, partial [Ardenticatenaceae bacterium]|nr:glycosyl hydrolase family 18 protein [Ardenticatenaceae bacterium]
MTSWRRLFFGLLAVLLLVAPLPAAGAGLKPALTGPSGATAVADWDIPNGHFFTQTGGGSGRGYAVSDDGGVRFWSEFRRLGGVAAVGYPASQRFEWDGFTVQVFQRVVFQWRPEVGRVYFVNVFDRLDQLGANDWLLHRRQTPYPRQWDEAGLSWEQIVRRRLTILDAYPAIRAAYNGVVGDPIQANGLPTSDVVDMGNHYALRAQRVVFQLWKEDVPWARRGQVTVALGGDIAKEVGILPNPAALEPVAPDAAGQPAPPPPAPTQAPQPAPPSTNGAGKVLAYYVPWDSTSWASLQANAARIDYVGAQWVSVNACGNIGSRDDQVVKQFARERGIPLFPSLLTASAWLNSRLLTDAAASENLINQIVAYVVEEDYPGFDLDLEGVRAEERPAYSAFVARLAAALHARGKLLALAIPAKTREATTGWPGAYDYAALGRHADLITIMSYDYSGAWGPPGPVAPQNWVEGVAAYATSQIPAHKVMLGLAFYGYDWNVTTGFPTRSLTFGQAQWLSDQYGVPLAQDPAARS